MTIRRTVLAASLACGMIGFLGCSSGPKMAPVSGTVTYKGKAVVGASVVFYPEAEHARSSMGQTDDQGRYTLWTFTPGDGALVGKHSVAITLRGPPEKAAIHPSMKNKELGEAYYDQVAGTGKPLLPEKYFSAPTSGLSAVVIEGKNNICDFPLEGELPKK